MKKTMLLMLALAACEAARAGAFSFADAVVNYQPGAGYSQGFIHPQTALGEPSRVNPFGEAVDPFNPPYGTNQVVSIGEGGSLTLAFQPPLLNHPQNPSGFDFIIFGNAGFVVTNDFDLETFTWIGTPATDGSLFAANDGTTRVSVSQDGITFYPLRAAVAPVVDRFYPVDASGDFHRPIPSQVQPGDLAGATLEGIRALYAGSAGGTAYDISWAENAEGAPIVLPEVRFVRVEVLTGKSEVDAISAVRPTGVTVHQEDFTGNPATQGWRTFGDASLFHWNATNGNLEVTWDSSRSNSYFYYPLSTVLSKTDPFSVSFDLQLKDIEHGTDPNKPITFQIAVGLLNYRAATNSNYYRGAGTASSAGMRNFLEWDYFPDDGFGATWATTVVSTNLRYAFAHNFPLELSPGDVYRIKLTYTTNDQTLRTSATKNGVPYGMPPNNTLQSVILASASDFRLDTFAIMSYSDAVQVGPASEWGSLLAHGVVDNITLDVPAPALGAVFATMTNSVPTFQVESKTNWLYTLERSTDLMSWAGTAPATNGNGSTLSLSDPVAPAERAFYRIRAERP